MVIRVWYVVLAIVQVTAADDVHTMMKLPFGCRVGFIVKKIGIEYLGCNVQLQLR